MKAQIGIHNRIILSNGIKLKTDEREASLRRNLGVYLGGGFLGLGCEIELNKMNLVLSGLYERRTSISGTGSLGNILLSTRSQGIIFDVALEFPF